MFRTRAISWPLRLALIWNSIVCFMIKFLGNSSQFQYRSSGQMDWNRCMSMPENKFRAQYIFTYFCLIVGRRLKNQVNQDYLDHSPGDTYFKRAQAHWLMSPRSNGPNSMTLIMISITLEQSIIVVRSDTMDKTQGLTTSSPITNIPPTHQKQLTSATSTDSYPTWCRRKFQ